MSPMSPIDASFDAGHHGYSVKASPKTRPMAKANAVSQYGVVPAKITYPRMAVIEKLIEGDLSLLPFPIAKEWRKYWIGLILTTEKHFAKRFLLYVIGGEITREEFMLHFYLEYVDRSGGRDRSTTKIRRRIIRVGMTQMAPGIARPIQHIWDTYRVDSLPKWRVPACLWPVIPGAKGSTKVGKS